MLHEVKISQVCPYLNEEEALAASDVVRTTWLTEGEKCFEFSQKLNDLIGVKYGVFAPNGTLALVLGLMALGIKPGDEVIVPNITFIGSATSIMMLGAKPVLIDVDNETFQINTTLVERALTKRTKAIMPVHLYGTACDMSEIINLSEKYSLKIIEDAAQGIGVFYKKQHVGSFGDVGCFSFFADKTITTGEGGYVTCKDEETYQNLLYLRNQGRLDRGSFIHPELGYNFRITDIQAAIGIVQMQKLPKIVKRKQEIFSLYQKYLADLPDLRLLSNEKHSNHVPFRCVIITKYAHELMRYLDDTVQTRSFFYPLHMQPCIQEYHNKSHFPDENLDVKYQNSIFGYKNGLCLPIFPSLTNDQVRFICQKIKEHYFSCTNH